MARLAVPRMMAADAPPNGNSLGHHPSLPPGLPWPVCEKSGARMALFFQFDTALELGPRLNPRCFSGPSGAHPLSPSKGPSHTVTASSACLHVGRHCA